MVQSLEIENKPSEKIFTREFVLLSVWAFFVSNNFYSLLTAVPLYSLRVLELTEAEAGLAAGLFIAGMLVSRFTAGKLTERFGFKHMLIVNLSCLIAFTLLYFLINSAGTLYILRVASGFFFGLVNNTLITTVSFIMPKNRIGEAIGYYSMIQMCAWATGPYISIFFANRGDYNALFLFCAVLPALALATIPFMRMSKIREAIARDEASSATNELNSNAGQDVSVKASFLDNFIEKAVLPVALVCLFMVMFNTSLTSFIAPYSETIGLAEAASVFFIFYVLGLICTRPIVSKLFDKKGATFVLIPGACIYALAFLALSMVNSQLSLMICGVLAGIGLGACQNTTNSLALSIVPTKRLGFANATYFAAFDTCAASGPLIAGLLIAAIGYRPMFVVAAIWTALGIPVYLFISRKLINKQQNIVNR